MNILVVEDDPASAKLVYNVLTAEGYIVESVETAEQAIAVIIDAKPECIVLDLLLPGIDGVTLARKLKQNPDTRHIAIIATTAYSNLWSEQEINTMGCAAFLVKPVRPRVLCQHVATIAAQHPEH